MWRSLLKTTNNTICWNKFYEKAPCTWVSHHKEDPRQPYAHLPSGPLENGPSSRGLKGFYDPRKPSEHSPLLNSGSSETPPKSTNPKPRVPWCGMDIEHKAEDMRQLQVSTSFWEVKWEKKVVYAILSQSIVSLKRHQIIETRAYPRIGYALVTGKIPSKNSFCAISEF